MSSVQRSLLIPLLLIFLIYPIPPTAADEFIGTYFFRESYVPPVGMLVTNELYINLWKIDNSENLMIQFINQDIADEYYLIQYFDDSLMFFEKDNKIYTFANMLNCEAKIKAAGNIWGTKGLWQIILR